MTKKTVIIREFPVDLHAEFKSLCALESVPMQKKIIELVAEWVEYRKTVKK